MKQLIAFLIVLLHGAAMYAADPFPTPSIAVVSSGEDPVLTTANFVVVRQFILAGGWRRTYCNRYNDNPFHPFTGFNAYLNPTGNAWNLNVNCDPAKCNFNQLVIQYSSDLPTQYWNIDLDQRGAALIITQYYVSTPRETLIKEVRHYFEAMLREIAEKKEHSDKKPKAP